MFTCHNVILHTIFCKFYNVGWRTWIFDVKNEASGRVVQVFRLQDVITVAFVSRITRIIWQINFSFHDLIDESSIQSDNSNNLFNKYFSGIAIIGGSIGIGDYLDDVEVVSIKNDSISLINATIPSLPKGLINLRGSKFFTLLN